MNNKSLVKCDVDNCKYNDSNNCSLDTLNISYLSKKHNCTNKSETICNNFLKDKITNEK